MGIYYDTGEIIGKYHQECIVSYMAVSEIFKGNYNEFPKKLPCEYSRESNGHFGCQDHPEKVP